ADGEPEVQERDGTTEAVAWVPVLDVGSDGFPVSAVVTAALRMGSGR
ncbi:MAG: hypothetical protein JWQ15_1911, partial [Marmoricola sp.]|nr:hypothetical protein [Marmoricola sp.]